MNYNFSDQVRKVLGMAREEAIRLHHDYVGTEHILLGVIRESDGIAAAVLAHLSVRPEQVKERIEESVRRGTAITTLGELPYTSRAKKVLEFSMAEARELDHSHVGTEHLLLGLLREEKGIAAEVLNQLGVTLEEARRQTLIRLGTAPNAVQAAGTPASRWTNRGRRKVSTKMRVFGGMATETAALSSAIQEWIDEREAEGFQVTDKSVQVVESWVIVTVWMGQGLV
jgi:ATP-dependent Clp protease ATP-binding subunit ClpC